MLISYTLLRVPVRSITSCSNSSWVKAQVPNYGPELPLALLVLVTYQFFF